jgi:hypothetical protein
MMRRVFTALLLIAIGVFIVALMEPEEYAEGDGDVSGGAQASQADPPSAGDVYRDLELGRV